MTFIQNGLAVLTASLDGTVRAFDTTRYRNFRTLTSPQAAQVITERSTSCTVSTALHTSVLQCVSLTSYA